MNETQKPKKERLAVLISQEADTMLRNGLRRQGDLSKRVEAAIKAMYGKQQ